MKKNIFWVILFFCCHPVWGQDCECHPDQDLQHMLRWARTLSPLPFDTTGPLTTWSGISLNEDGCVQAIELPSLAMKGSIPYNTVGQLSCLQSLNLSDNKLSGIVPVDLVDLTQLEYLNLSYNSLVGPLPPDMALLSHLTAVRLQSNKFSDRLPQFGDNPNLIELFLSDNYFYGEIPASYELLSGLEALGLQNNDLSGPLPEYLAQLPCLYVFVISGNGFSGYADINLAFDQLLCNKSRSLVVNISENEFTHIPFVSLTTFAEDKFQVQNNRLTFDDILPNIHLFEGIFIGSYSVERYAPQKPFSGDTTLIFSTRDNPLIQLNIDSTVTGSEYTWYKDDVAITTTGHNYLDLKSVFNLPKDMPGVYRCEVINRDVPELTLYSGNYTVQIDLPDQFNIEFPSAFTPNGDGYNDTFIIPAIQEGNYLVNEFDVYDREGKLVLHINNYLNGWDGKDQSQSDLPIGTYYYRFHSEGNTFKGTITLLR